MNQRNKYRLDNLAIIQNILKIMIFKKLKKKENFCHISIKDMSMDNALYGKIVKDKKYTEDFIVLIKVFQNIIIMTTNASKNCL